MKQFMNHCGSTLGADFYLTPRDSVKAFVGLLSLMEQNPEARWQSLLPQTVIHRSDDPEAGPPVPDDVEKNPTGGSDSPEADLTSFRL